MSTIIPFSRSFFAARTYSPRNVAQVVTDLAEPEEPLVHTLTYSYGGRGIRSIRTESPSDGPGTLARPLVMTWEGPEENYNIFRWYRAGWGRYTQAAPFVAARPLLEHLDKHLYRYAESRPAYYVDPRGLSAAKLQPPTPTGNCAADCIAYHRWGLHLLHEAETGIKIAEAVQTIGLSAAERLCKGHGGEAELLEGAGKMTYTSVTSSTLAEKLINKSLANCLKTCNSGENCGRLPHDFGGCESSSPNANSRPYALIDE